MDRAAAGWAFNTESSCAARGFERAFFELEINGQLDLMLEDSRVDAARPVTGMGHSFGGYTMFALAGAVYDTNTWADRCDGSTSPDDEPELSADDPLRSARRRRQPSREPCQDILRWITSCGWDAVLPGRPHWRMRKADLLDGRGDSGAGIRVRGFGRGAIHAGGVHRSHVFCPVVTGEFEKKSWKNSLKQLTGKTHWKNSLENKKIQ